MKTQLIRAGLISIALAALPTGDASAQSVIARWSFDTGMITTDANGILTAADQTGNHNATRTNAATGVRPINSVPGQFGQAAEFTNLIDVETGGASQLQFSNLTEITGASGGDFTVAAWAKTSAVGQDNTILSDWSGTNTYWFELDAVDSNTAARPRGQLRNTTGADLVAATLSAAETGLTNVADGNWHHYAWTWAKTAGTMSFYVDGVLHAGATRTTGQADHNLRASTNVNAHLGWKQDSNDHFSGTMDEVWVINGALTAEQVLDGTNNNFANVFQPPTPTNLTLEVNAVTGAVTLQNTTTNPVAISSYRITSSGLSLNPAGWDPIATGTPVAGFPQGNGSGNGWEIAPNPSDMELVEWFLTGDSTIAASGSISLGNASFPTVAVGDHDNNGVVDAADYVVWRNDGLDQTQYNNWKANFGKRKGTQDLVFQYTLADGTIKTGTVTYVAAAGGSSVGAGVVPEPACVALVLMAAFVGSLTRRTRRVVSR